MRAIIQFLAMILDADIGIDGNRRNHRKRCIAGLRATLVALSVMSSSFAHAEIFFIHNDHRGAPLAVTNQAGTVVWQATYDPFGKATITTQTKTLNLRLPGQYFDAETGLHYNYYRDYDPTTGRYLQPDPIGLAGGVNPYAYVENNPLRFVDPLGLAEFPNPTGIVPGGPWTPAGPGQLPGDFYGPKKPSGGRDLCRYVPDENNGGPPGVKDPYWKAKSPGGIGSATRCSVVYQLRLRKLIRGRERRLIYLQFQESLLGRGLVCSVV